MTVPGSGIGIVSSVRTGFGTSEKPVGSTSVKPKRISSSSPGSFKEWVPSRPPSAKSPAPALFRSKSGRSQVEDEEISLFDVGKGIADQRSVSDEVILEGRIILCGPSSRNRPVKSASIMIVAACMGSVGAISNRNDRHEIEDTHSYRIRRIKLPFPGKFGSITIFCGRAFRVKKTRMNRPDLRCSRRAGMPGSHQAIESRQPTESRQRAVMRKRYTSLTFSFRGRIPYFAS